jgi:hypothetical protein
VIRHVEVVSHALGLSSVARSLLLERTHCRTTWRPGRPDSTANGAKRSDITGGLSIPTPLADKPGGGNAPVCSRMIGATHVYYYSAPCVRQPFQADLFYLFALQPGRQVSLERLTYVNRRCSTTERRETLCPRIWLVT